MTTAVLTGATSGIGAATAQRLAACVDTLVLLGPDAAAPPVRARYVQADFTDLSQVAEAAASIRSDVETVDLLINNAGVPGAPERTLTGDGNERTLQVNVLAPAAFTEALLPVIPTGGRIVNVASAAHHFGDFDPDDPDFTSGYNGTIAYGRTKSAVVTWTLWLARHLDGVDMVTLCPGVTNTPLARAMMGGPVGSSTDAAARRVMQAAFESLNSGTYLENGRVTRPSAFASSTRDQDRVARLIHDRIARRPASAE
jgi:NAD(P)-dependent dehydrogenase (short-subunit alcohol dehydrogenase family)